MSLALRHPSPPERSAAPLGRLRALLPAISARAAALDADGAFPDEDVAALDAEGLLRAPLSGGDGAGWGTTPEGAAPPEEGAPQEAAPPEGAAPEEAAPEEAAPEGEQQPQE